MIYRIIIITTRSQNVCDKKFITHQIQFKIPTDSCYVCDMDIMILNSLNDSFLEYNIILYIIVCMSLVWYM